ncbi:DUF6286 domain-containing protein [Rhodococcus sp. H29-C3]|uniref:DUF6286 domain-containing Asp23/Gls24 family envelope stress response protein n=1 Tax=Rhodococcus sp. H29-C3 TaxID=3046307 RepID=UPI0024BA9421|nr:DUF6286 domain-containing protein [Rhodococcus sp. H29-C3]MDJ0358806.1 DUF6286 domain-containing protein [Rhodococcus sp. H29-C3]
MVDTDSAASTDTGGRGTLVIKERAIERVAVAAALAVPDVVRSVGGISRLTGRDLPRADASVGEYSVSINLYVSLTWPCRIADVSEAVHTEVARTLDNIVGLPLYRLNVMVAATSAGEAVEQQISDETTVAAPRPRPPAASPAALPVAVTLAFGLLALAFVAGREFLIVHDTISGAPWIRNTIEQIAELHWARWMIAASGAAMVAGLILLAIGVKPRTQTHTGATSPTSSLPMVWMRPTDVARMCSDHAGDVPGVESARTTVTKKHITVEVHRTEAGEDRALTEAVRDAIAPTLSVLADNRDTRIRLEQTRE